MASNYGLGPDYDLSAGAVAINAATAGVTGSRVNMQNIKSIDIVVVKGVGTDAEDPTFTLKSHAAASGGAGTDLPVISEYFLKAADPALLGSETWTKVTQTAAATVVDPGGAGTSAEEAQILVINVAADQMPVAHNWLSLNCSDVGDDPQLVTVLYVIHKHDKGDPTAFPAPLR